MKQDGKVTLDIRQYEVLAEADRFENDNGELELPDSINGKAVIGLEDGYVVGGDLQRSDDWELCVAHAHVESAVVTLREQFDLDDEAVTLLKNAASEAAYELGAEELFAWRKHRESQRYNLCFGRKPTP
jgi:hypothetical protein